MEVVVSSEKGACHANGDEESDGKSNVPERLLKRDQERQEELLRRKEAKESLSVREEKIDFFTSAFNKEKAAIEDVLLGCTEGDGGTTATVLEEVSSRIQQLQKFLNDSMSFLTQYELRQAQASLQKLQSTLGEKRDKLMPKKKFAFRSRNTGTSKSKESPDFKKEDSPGSSAVDGTEGRAGGSSGPMAVDGVISEQQCGLSNADSQVFVKGADEIQQSDVLLTHLSNCKVKLLGSPSTLHVKHVRDCEILCGPVSSSIFVDHCSGCTFAFSCQQLRTHNTTDCQVYLHVTSRAIIEDCSGVRFAPFSWSYPGMEADFEVSGLDRAKNNWSQVDDFNWLAADSPSPNWGVIPEHERKSEWD
ncbi:TBCC protein, partial [Atractosteus spatula]|nr:TBCC protein [Atractosteus spatula]